MAKTKEELYDLKLEFETLTNKLKDLTQEELKLVVGGVYIPNTSPAYTPSSMFSNSDKLV